MITELVTLHIKEGHSPQFELDFKKASLFIIQIEGYIDNTLFKCIEESNKYVLKVEWNSLTDHTIGFRNSSQYQKWKKLLHHYYDPFPKVEHYRLVG